MKSIRGGSGLIIPGEGSEVLTGDMEEREKKSTWRKKRADTNASDSTYASSITTDFGGRSLHSDSISSAPIPSSSPSCNSVEWCEDNDSHDDVSGNKVLHGIKSLRRKCSLKARRRRCSGFTDEVHLGDILDLAHKTSL